MHGQQNVKISYCCFVYKRVAINISHYRMSFSESHIQIKLLHYGENKISRLKL